MARISPSVIKGRAFDIEIIGERIEEGQLVLTLGNVMPHRRHPAYWWFIFKAVLRLGRRALVRRVSRGN